jgi:GT2 family glycosyltransferase
MTDPSNRKPADIIVCVHNGLSFIRECLVSVQASMGSADRLIIVDDGSEVETQRACEEFVMFDPERTKLIRRDKGSGFCRAANDGLKNSNAPTIIVLNSDTIVTEGWIDRIDKCLYSNWQIGLVGPLTNAGSWQTIPSWTSAQAAIVPIKKDKITLNAIKNYCDGLSARYDYPIVEQINGFCYALRREVLDEVGQFDEMRFPNGYGEEVDYTFRVQDAGYLCAVAIDCFVYHAKTKSYTPESRIKLNKAGQDQIQELYGPTRVADAVIGTRENPILDAIRKEALLEFEKNRWLLE